ncbi:MAG TPA: winged helix-turn-helix transcriptional regulator [Thermoplasmatales archaeon]|nr:winged helix-turn-helix transcriptional regulator [Thermoplasmatales archaeon]HEX08713.1 winged helix-turn-helix transcriptional regulator [Thermoplasmatales archaeon]
MKRTALFMSFLIITLSLPSYAAALEPITPSFSFNVTIIAITIAAIAIIVTFFFIHAGVKYVTPENVLSSEPRKKIYHYIEEYPGSHLREIARDLNMKPSNVSWHLRKLEQTNLIRSRRIGGKRVYYLVEGGIEARRIAIAESILKNRNAREILEYLRENPGKHLLEISRALDLNHHTVKWHLKKLHLANLIEDHSTNSHPKYFPTEIATHILSNIRPPGRNA